jgi:hypothetical protein
VDRDIEKATCTVEELQLVSTSQHAQDLLERLERKEASQVFLLIKGCRS